MITYVGFQGPVTLNAVGTEYWSPTDSKFNGITCQDKGTHLLFTMQIRGKTKRVKVPLTYVSQVSEEDDEKKGKEE